MLPNIKWFYPEDSQGVRFQSRNPLMNFILNLYQIIPTKALVFITYATDLHPAELSTAAQPADQVSIVSIKPNDINLCVFFQFCSVCPHNGPVIHLQYFTVYLVFPEIRLIFSQQFNVLFTVYFQIFILLSVSEILSYLRVEYSFIQKIFSFFLHCARFVLRPRDINHRCFQNLFK